MRDMLAEGGSVGSVRWEALSLTDDEWAAVEARMDANGFVFVEPAQPPTDLASWRRWAYFNRLERIPMAPLGATTGPILRETRGVTLTSVIKEARTFSTLDDTYEAVCKCTRAAGVSAGMSGGAAWKAFTPSKSEFVATARAQHIGVDVDPEPLPMPPPTEIAYRWGDATEVEGRPTIIAHIVDTTGAWGKGFTGSLSRKWSAPEDRYRWWHKTKQGFELGEVQLVRAAENIWVANLLAQKGRRRKSPSSPPLVKYDVLDACLETLRKMALEHKAEVQMPRIGTGLAGGTWADIEPMVSAVAEDVRVTVFDFA